MAQRNPTDRSDRPDRPKRPLKPGQGTLHITHPNAAGIDIGSGSHFVAVPPDRDEQPVREFKSFTAELHRLADWLDGCGVDTVAMESTGVYWIPLFELLERRGFTVLLVNARHVKNVSGRKSDVLDCQWLQQLHSFGLLHGAFRPGDAVCVLRALTRQRAATLRTQARCVHHMQKALTQMNVQLANVIADVVGETGQKILRAIVAGERDAHTLAALKNNMIHASADELAASLQGNWRSEHVFALKQRPWPASTSAPPNSPSATARSRRSCACCKSAKTSSPRPSRARSAATPRTRRSSICARACTGCAGSI